MAETTIQRGIAVVWGVTTTGYTFDGSAGSLRTEEEDVGKTSQVEEHYDPNSGSVIGETIFRRLSTLRFRYYPSADTLANARTANVMPDVGAELRITGSTAGGADFDIMPEDAGAGNRSGYWRVSETSKQRRVGNKVYMDITCIRHGDNGNGTAKRISEIIS